MSKKDIDDTRNKYENIKKEFYSNNNITLIKTCFDNKNKLYEKYYVTKEIISMICSFEKNIVNIDYIIAIIYDLYDKKDNKFVILHDELNNFFEEYRNLYASIDLQIKNIISKFKI